MLAAFATAPNPSDPLAALEVGERPDPEAPDGWTTVRSGPRASTTTTCGRCVGSGIAEASSR